MIIREEQIGPCRLILGDCTKVLPLLSDIDAVITDPPYGEKTHKGARSSSTGPLNLFVTFPHIDDALFVAMAKQWVSLSKGWVVATCDWRHAAAAEREMPDEYIRSGIWVKSNYAPQFTGDRPATGWEAIAIMHRQGRKTWNGGGKCAVWTHPQNNDSSIPTQKPIGLIREFVRLFSNIDNMILDPFMGSGTTGEACIETGRRFTGIEADPAHFDIARARVCKAWNENKRAFKLEDLPRVKHAIKGFDL